MVSFQDAHVDLGAAGVEGIPEEGHDFAGVAAHAADVEDDDVPHAFMHGAGQQAFHPRAQAALEYGGPRR